MVRVLVAGNINGQLDVLFEKVQKLNMGKSGPFDLLFCVGAFSSSDRDEEIAKYITDRSDSSLKPPLPTYFFEPGSSTILQQLLKEHETEVQEISPLLFYLGTGGIKTIGKLTVAFLSRCSAQEDIAFARRVGAMGGYGGADFLLSTDWPRGFDAYLPDAVLQQLQDIGVCASVTGSIKSAEMAQISRPRYHIASDQGVYFQRQPYRNCINSSNEKGRSHVTRMIGLGHCSPSSVEKDKKWLHAVSVEPIAFMNRDSLAEEPTGTTENPYISAIYRQENTKRIADFSIDILEKRSKQGLGSIEDDSLKKGTAIPSWVSKIEQTQKDSNAGVFFWGDRKIPSNRTQTNVKAVDPSNTSVFIGNVPNDVQEVELMVVLLGAGCTPSDILKITTTQKGYAFVNFASHQAAAHSISILNNVAAFGKTLTCNWGSTNVRNNRHRQTYNDTRTNCWFCVANSEFEEHLVICIAEECYLAIPKGSLVPFHALIVPISHAQRYSELSAECAKEVQGLKKALQTFYASQNCELFCFERCMETKGANHMHIQAIPIPTGEAARSAQMLLKAEGIQHNMSFKELPSSVDLKEALESGQYFYAEVPGKTAGGIVTLLYESGSSDNEQGKPFIPMQFGRDVAARLLLMPARAHWKACEVSKGEESILTEAFKKAFEPYSPL